MHGVAFHPDFGCDVDFTSQSMPDAPDTQVETTIGAMRQLVLQDAPYMRSEALSAASRGNGDAVSGVFDYVKGRMRFQEDDKTASSIKDFIPYADERPIVEVLIRPRDLSQLCMLQNNGVGDCDDFSMYCAALLTALNVPCSFATVAADGADPNAYSHVYVVAYPFGYGNVRNNGARVALDCSHGPHVGWEAPNRFGKFREWPVMQSTANIDGAIQVIPWLIVAGVAIACLAKQRQGRN